jgi:hypothetical protein
MAYHDEEESKLYYFRTSPGIGTNLQLYSLRQAWRCWQDLDLKKDRLASGKIRERCVVIVDLLGLSLSQLLGQNTPRNSESVQTPRKLLPLFLEQASLPDAEKENLEERFRGFITVYDACRHFGPPKYATIDSLNVAKTESFVYLTVDIWNVVLKHYAAGQDVFKSITEILDESNEDEEYVYS